MNKWIATLSSKMSLSTKAKSKAEATRNIFRQIIQLRKEGKIAGYVSITDMHIADAIRA